MALKALIFDVDGTLANTERDGHLLAFNLAFKELNLDWHWNNELYHKLLDIAGGKLRIKHYIKNYHSDFECDNIDIFAKNTHALKTKIYVDLVGAGKIPLRTGVARLLDEARAAGLRLAIATTTTEANVTALIANTLGRDALDWFEVIGAGDCVAKLKPAGDIYTYVLQKMQLNSSECLAFEDSNNGIKSATEAGIKCVISVNEYTNSHNFDGAIVVLNNLGEPNQPFTLIAGADCQPNYVNVDYLKRLYAKYC